MTSFHSARSWIAALSLLTATAAGPLAAQTKDQSEAPAPKVSIAAAYSEEITEEAVMIGKGEAIDQVDIVARVSGFVQEVKVQDGATVQKGDLLYSIEPDSYVATLEARKADLGKAEANLELATIELGRKAELLARGSAPESERDIARANELGAEAAVKSAKAAIRQAELELSYTEIHAPFSGRVGRSSVSVGELVNPNSGALITLVREAPIYVRFSLSEKQLGDVLETLETNAADLASMEQTPDVFLTLPNGTELKEPGKIIFLDNRISPTTGTISLLAEFENTRRLILDGAFLQVRIAALQPTLSLLVPQAALQRDQRGDFVLVVNAQQMVEQRYIETGKPVGAAIIVTEGLQEGESVIVEGLQRVRPGVQVDAILAGSQEEK
ncbi:efflux RND transporter periplasmic adaptor subunit [Sedimentitalea sp. HM32M-2]|uniref:efflux RND transporter periplasmic adaptor subunit n=1 Tax=Sedimentitalea sp. HM32M-2 TaxID=3351566 RepID=UPI0036406B4C